MNTTPFFKTLPQPVMPVITIPSDEAVKPMVDAIVAGGCQVLEITLRTPAGLKAINYAREHYPDAVVGAGSVMTVEQWRAVEDAGGQFIISPGATASLYALNETSLTPWLPGVANASDLMRAAEAGLTHVKFFPAMTLGGLPALQNYASVFPQMHFCPTGGIKPEDLDQWFAKSMIFAVGGSWFTPKHLTQASQWDELKKHITAFWQSFNGQ